MKFERTYIAAALTATMLAASVSSADARWWHHGGRGYYDHGGPGLVGGAVIGALTVATLPFAIIGSAVAPSHPPYREYGPPPPPQEYGYDRRYYGPPAPPPGYARGYGPPTGYYGGY